MILIGGTGLSPEDLPLNDVLNYVVESNDSTLGIKLKTVAKSSDCIGVYLHTDFNDVDLVPDVFEKTIYFNNDEHLIAILDAGGLLPDHNEESDAEESSDDNEMITSEVRQDGEDIPANTNPELEPITVEEVQEVDFGDDEEIFLTIPSISANMDNMTVTLETQQRIIDQKDDQILELKKNINDLYSLQEIQLIEMRDVYEKRIGEAESIISDLRSQVSNATAVPEEARDFVKYVSYSTSPKAMSSEGFSQEEISELGSLTSNFYIFACASGDSYYSLMGNIKELVNNHERPLIVDFSNDLYLVMSYKIPNQESSLRLNEDGVEPGTLVQPCGKANLIPTSSFNDIAFLTMDWAKIVKKLNILASGRPIILLFNNISSFSVRHTVSRLATIGKLFIFAKSNPVTLASVYYDLRFIPTNRFKLVALDYIDAIKPTREALIKKYGDVPAFKGLVSWGDLRINL